MPGSKNGPATIQIPKHLRGTVELLIATRKGAFRLKSDAERSKWKLRGPLHLGQIVNHMVLDPRDKKTMLMAARPGHLGPSLFRSTDKGKTWTEAKRPPAFPKAKTGKGAKWKVVKHIFWLQPGHVEEPGVWYAGTSPPALFKSTDGGDTWKSVAGFNDHKMYKKWTTPDQEGLPDGSTLHSINVDPRDKRHLIIGVSAGGVFESTDGGKDWQPINKGCAVDFIPGEPEYGHDPHCLAVHPVDPDRLWQQNHCGIYRMDRSAGAEDRWIRVGDNMPKAIGDIGFPIILHPRDPDTAWVFPMDGTDVWPRTSPGGKPATYITRNAGKTWKRQDAGLPTEQAWFTVKRQSMAQDSRESIGLYFGTTSGEVWASKNAGGRWKCIAKHLPHIYSVEVAGVHQ
ncbi:MAG: photosystem II stability/assembly factor-like uncharacterized protein [Planctomycetota bacterium]|jgi:photosystem II stability/assembly factor-like uncharacterized protein